MQRKHIWLYSLGLFEEAISWSKACIGPRQTADAVCQALIEYEAQLAGGRIRGIERSGPGTRYTVSVFEPAQARQTGPRLKAAMKAFAPFQEVYLDWVSHDSPALLCPRPCNTRHSTPGLRCAYIGGVMSPARVSV